MTAARARTAVCDGPSCTARITIGKVDDGGAQEVLIQQGWQMLTVGWDTLVFCPDCGPVQAKP